MAFIPRRYPSAASFPSELRTPPKAHAPIPTPDKVRSSEAPRKGALRVGYGTLSLKGYEPDPHELVKTMFGKEATIDSNTGQLVCNIAAPAHPAIRPGG